MMNKAVVTDAEVQPGLRLVVNVIVIGDTAPVIPGHTLIDQGNAQPGDLWDGSAFHRPPPPNTGVQTWDFLNGAILATERQAIIAAGRADDEVADAWGQVASMSYVTVGDDTADPEHVRLVEFLDFFVGKGLLTAERKAEILAWRPGDQPAAARDDDRIGGRPGPS